MGIKVKRNRYPRDLNSKRYERNSVMGYTGIPRSASIGYIKYLFYFVSGTFRDMCASIVLIETSIST